MRYSVVFRLWHWLNFFVILGLLGTVFLRKTFLSWRTNSEILMSKLGEFDILITHEQAKILAKAIRAGMWEWHIILGYALLFVLVYRVVLYFKDSSHREKFSELTNHKKVVHSLYYIFYTVLTFMTISGFLILFYKELGFSKELAHEIKELHEFSYQFILYFVPLHIVGVVIAEIKEDKGLISSMISGSKKA